MASFWISLTPFIFFVFGHHYCNTTTCTGWSTQVTYLGERSEGVVWNGSRYTFRNVIAADETERWKCHAHEYDDADARSYEYNLHSDANVFAEILLFLIHSPLDMRTEFHHIG
eukprot:1072955_1